MVCEIKSRVSKFGTETWHEYCISTITVTLMLLTLQMAGLIPISSSLYFEW